MAKRRQVVQVDEEKLKMMMAGDIPLKVDPDKDIVISSIRSEKRNDIPVNSEQAKGEDITLDSTDTEKSGSMESDTTNSPRDGKRKKNRVSYTGQFLYKPGPGSRRQSTIHLDESNYRNIFLILKVTDNLSIANFINNVLTHHFELYKNEIDETIKEYFDDLYKK